MAGMVVAPVGVPRLPEQRPHPGQINPTHPLPALGITASVTTGLAFWGHRGRLRPGSPAALGVPGCGRVPLTRTSASTGFLPPSVPPSCLCRGHQPWIRVHPKSRLMAPETLPCLHLQRPHFKEGRVPRSGGGDIFGGHCAALSTSSAPWGRGGGGSVARSPRGQEAKLSGRAQSPGRRGACRGAGGRALHEGEPPLAAEVRAGEEEEEQARPWGPCVDAEN